MKFLQFACMVGLAAALSLSASHGPSNVNESARVEEPVRAEMPLHVNETQAQTATPPLTVVASTEALPDRFSEAPATTDPLPAAPSGLAYAVPDGALDSTSHMSPLFERETPNFSYLANYAFSEAPPPEAPADTVLRALRGVPEGTPREEVQRAARAFGLDVVFMEAVAKIESDFNPKGRTGSYIGLFQLSKHEFDLYGSGEITDARDNAVAGSYKFIVEAILFELQTHKKPTLADLYLIHQQGTQGAAEHIAHPERLAWESMCATDEGKVKGERWCKRAIWQNTLPLVKQMYGSVEKLSSAAFVEMWRDRVVTLYQRYSANASATVSP
jgi:hypothetical protein